MSPVLDSLLERYVAFLENLTHPYGLIGWDQLDRLVEPKLAHADGLKFEEPKEENRMKITMKRTILIF